MFALLAISVSAQEPATPTQSLPVSQPSTKWDPAADARKEIERLRDLYQHGAVPKRALDVAEQKLAEAQDDEILKRTLYGKVEVGELTPEQIQEMVDAAQRQVDRQAARIAEEQKLVDEGVKARLALTPYLEDLDTKKRILELAQSRARLFEVLTELARLEAQHADENPAAALDTHRAVRYDGKGFVRETELAQIELAFQQRFGYPMPVSARGETAVHRSMGFDHRGRIDVAVNPDQAEGIWLRKYLERSTIPYFAFRNAIRGKATGAHIHIGPPSMRLAMGD